MTEVTELVHGKVRLALHAVREDGDGRSLLLLHGLGERAPERLPRELRDWPGPVHALDFTGHGASTLPAGGGYTCEILLADADRALQFLEEATVVGRGIGGYVGLMLAGARPEAVRGCVVCDGPGLLGGGPAPIAPTVCAPDTGASTHPDPFALTELARDIRPPDYASAFIRQAVMLSGLDWPVTVAARQHAPWLDAIVNEPGVRHSSLEDALLRYSAVD